MVKQPASSDTDHCVMIREMLMQVVKQSHLVLKNGAILYILKEIMTDSFFDIQYVCFFASLKG